MFVCTGAESYVYDYSASVDSFGSGDVTIYNGVVITATSIYGITTSGTVHLYNSGTINGDIDTQGNNLFVYNSGTINGSINATGSNVVQVIRSDAELQSVNVIGGDKSICVDNYQGVNFDNIKDINASGFTINTSTVEINDFSDWQNWDKNVTLEGDILLVINSAETVNPGEVIRHTSEETTLHVQIVDLDKMYKPELKSINGGLVLNIVRETNYDIVFGNVQRTSALELIRQKHPNDKFIMSLDVASNMDEINRLKSLSYRFSHDILLRPVKVINNFSLLDKGDFDTGIGIIPYYIVSDKINDIGGRVYLGYKDDSLYFGAGFSFNNFNYEDSLNEFSGMLYGLDIKSKQKFDKFWLNEKLGISLTDYKGEYISTYGNLKENPLGLSWYGDVEVGYDFDVMRDVIIAPVAGFMYQQYNVADVSETDTYVHGGMNAKYSFITDGIKYEYSLFGGAGTNKNLFADMKIGFMSITDNAGVSLGASIFKDDFDISYRFFMDAKLLF